MRIQKYQIPQTIKACNHFIPSSAFLFYPVTLEINSADCPEHTPETWRFVTDSFDPCMNETSIPEPGHPMFLFTCVETGGTSGTLHQMVVEEAQQTIPNPERCAETIDYGWYVRFRFEPSHSEPFFCTVTSLLDPFDGNRNECLYPEE